MTRVRRVILLGPMVRGPAERKFLSGVLKRLRLDPNRDRLIGVDGGALVALKLGLFPDLVIGDWDGVSARERKLILASFPHVILSTEKDRSDFHFGLRAALAWSPEEIIALGFTGGRLDHQLGVLLDLAAFSKELPVMKGKAGAVHSLRMIGPEGEGFFLSERLPRWEGRLKKGQTVSVFALGGVAEGVRLEGFKYSHRALDLSPSSHGLSNLSEAPRQEIRVRRGSVVVMLPI